LSPGADGGTVVRPWSPADLDACLGVVGGLPDFFTPDVTGQVAMDLGQHRAWVIADAGEVAGFAVAAARGRRGAEILWAGVDAARRGRGLGTRLLDRVLDDLAADGVRVVLAKTLDGSAGYPPYEATRGFWEGRGFVQVDTIDPLPGWQPGNPSAIYVAALGPTR
jgi:ribosomal protein S18 acetylase RimI-like enzyme